MHKAKRLKSLRPERVAKLQYRNPRPQPQKLTMEVLDQAVAKMPVTQSTPIDCTQAPYIVNGPPISKLLQKPDLERMKNDFQEYNQRYLAQAIYLPACYSRPTENNHVIGTSSWGRVKFEETPE